MGVSLSWLCERDCCKKTAVAAVSSLRHVKLQFHTRLVTCAKARVDADQDVLRGRQSCRIINFA